MAEKDGGYVKEEKLTSGQAFKRFLWNPSTKEFLGRTGGSWGELIATAAEDIQFLLARNLPRRTARLRAHLASRYATCVTFTSL